MKDIEIEIQVRLENIQPLKNFLAKNAKHVGDEYQKDEYFTPAHRNFIETEPVNEWLRIRKTDDYSGINYKKIIRNSDDKTLYRDEYESMVDSDDQLQKIFQVIDLQSVIIVEKKRKIWLYRDWEIVIDTVTGLGEFVEIEYKGQEDEDPEKIMDKMYEFLRGLNVGKIEINHVGYPYLILYGIENQFEEV